MPEGIAGKCPLPKKQLLTEVDPLNFAIIWHPFLSKLTNHGSLIICGYGLSHIQVLRQGIVINVLEIRHLTP